MNKINETVGVLHQLTLESSDGTSTSHQLTPK